MTIHQVRIEAAWGNKPSSTLRSSGSVGRPIWTCTLNGISASGYTKSVAAARLRRKLFTT